jgi:hypothetical protein
VLHERLTGANVALPASRRRGIKIFHGRPPIDDRFSCNEMRTAFCLGKFRLPRAVVARAIRLKAIRNGSRIAIFCAPRGRSRSFKELCVVYAAENSATDVLKPFRV